MRLPTLLAPLHRRFFREEKGQALVLGGLLVFFVFIAVMVTFAIGHRTREKIKMQALTDSAAYSIAVAEARTFNYLAWTNRARVAHDVAILSIQAHISYISYMEGIMKATGYGLRAASIEIGLQLPECYFGLCCEAIADAKAVWDAASYYLGDDFPASGWYHQNWHENQTADLALGAAAVEHFGLIAAIAADQAAIVVDLGSKMLNQSFAVQAARTVDSNIQGPNGADVYNAANLASAIHIGDTDSNDDWNEIESATRYPDWVTNRSFVYASAHWWAAFGIGTEKMVSNCLFAAEAWDSGNAKTIGDSPSSLSSLKSKIHRGGDSSSGYAEGHAYGAEDHGGVAVEVGCYDICFGAGGWSSKAGVWGGPNEGKHFYSHGSAASESSTGRHGFPASRGIYIPHPRYKWGNDSKPVDDLWNQPHNVALLKKRMGQTANIYDFNLDMQIPLPIKFKTRNNTGDSDANNEMAALAGSLVYYHKPKKSGSDNWQEPPSFWNPFWRAKLHPVTLGGMAAAYVGHPSSGLAAGVTLGKGVNY